MGPDTIRMLLTARRRDLDLSQFDVGASLGWSQRKVSYLELGRQNITIEDLNEWSRALGLEAHIEIREAEDAEALTPDQAAFLEKLRRLLPVLPPAALAAIGAMVDTYAREVEKKREVG